MSRHLFAKGLETFFRYRVDNSGHAVSSGVNVTNPGDLGEEDKGQTSSLGRHTSCSPLLLCFFPLPIQNQQAGTIRIPPPRHNSRPSTCVLLGIAQPFVWLHHPLDTTQCLAVHALDPPFLKLIMLGPYYTLPVTLPIYLNLIRVVSACMSCVGSDDRRL